jgi:hypothetical protein
MQVPGTAVKGGYTGRANANAPREILSSGSNIPEGMLRLGSVE